MINEHVLQAFCSYPDFGDGRMASPFSLDKFTFATDGHIIVRIPRMDAVPENCKAPCPMKLPWDHEKLTAWHPMPEYTLPEKVTCPICAGTQYVSYCPRCDDLQPAKGADLAAVCAKVPRCPKCKTVLCRDLDVCDRCDWQGRAYSLEDQFFRVNIDTVQVNGHYLELIKTLPGPWRFALDPGKPKTETVRFKFDGGAGLLMPMLPNEGRVS